MKKDVSKYDDTESFCLKAYVPLGDSELLRDWNAVCQPKPPKGFGDYRWHKIVHDHLFVKEFGKKLDELSLAVEDLKTLIVEMNAKDSSKGLMK